MESQVTNYKCPACNGPLHFAGASGKLECEYCGSGYEVAAIEAMLKEQNERAAAAMAESEKNKWDTDHFVQDWGNDAKGMKVYQCSSCGAQMICDVNTAATCCPYCGSQTVVPGQFAGSLKPEFVLPFKTNKEQAKAALNTYYKKKKLLPGTFADGNHIEEVQGVYVPFWLFDCVAHGEMVFSASNTEKRRSGNEEITTTKYYDVRRSGRISFEKVPADASRRMPDDLMDSLEPFDYKELKPFSMAYMPGFLADRYDVEAEECGSRMQERCKSTFEDEVTKTVTGYDKKSLKSKSVFVSKGAVHYAMLPVWLLATRWNDKSFLFAMNGQSGKIVGDLPMDHGKFWGFFGAIAALLVGLMQALNFLAFKTPMTGVAMAVVCIALPILIALLIVLGMRGQLHTVSKKHKADLYMAGGGLKLTVRMDHFVRETTERRKINK